MNQAVRNTEGKFQFLKDGLPLCAPMDDTQFKLLVHKTVRDMTYKRPGTIILIETIDNKDGFRGQVKFVWFPQTGTQRISAIETPTFDGIV